MVAEAMRIKAEVYHGDKTCREIFGSLLSQIGLPNRLLSNQEIEECGYVKDTGFVWLKHKKKNKDDKKRHQDSFRFGNVMVCFEDEVTAYFQPNTIKKLTGVKAKEFVVWISLGEIHVNRPSGLITFKTQVGLLSKSLPLSVFEDVQGKHDVMEKPKQDQQKFNDPKIYLY
ncbi:hypothetical protein Bca4012_079031 [Brassica carinata]|uniref:DUF538 family protein n=4 Tax=Brassica TaxID=3705 RepID=A0A0D3DC86_BRAOL|nr:PREDICTED: uncharacterized protein LOC106305389 [Brassica oleracea var. oleracea]XP_048618189.1 uncharacterized protein LOC106350723 [Brassica napus]KAG2242454.1 hypothetical protein Bca52824_095703 [Brassica carinata]CAF2011169.1 unnamed protein product [Brassica napus]VDD38974.1 unnamed protein product [Brassica oleracea]